jgi:hypothetical protein
MKLVRYCAGIGVVAPLGLLVVSCVPDSPERAEVDTDSIQVEPGPGDLAPAAFPVDAVIMCHVPPGNPAARVTRRVPYSAVQAHLDHGDHLGPCRTQCSPIGAHCSRDYQCCGENCNYGVCSGSPNVCIHPGHSCTFDHQCCSASCFYGVCSGLPDACLYSGDSCTFDHQCCSGNCLAGVCKSAPGSCIAGGKSCTFDHQCCSGGCLHGYCASP